MALCSKGHRYQGKHCPHCSRSGASRPELNTYRWQRTRRYVRARDGERCQQCGSTNKLSVHHIIRGGPDTPDNLVTLCPTCHTRAERNETLPK